jgi:hypothetical protein
MARPSLFVRSLEQGEMEFLAHLRKSRSQALRQRAEILLASMVYTPVYQIALIFRIDEAYVRKVIHAFNHYGDARSRTGFGERVPAGSDSLRHAAWAGLQDSMPSAALALDPCGSRGHPAFGLPAQWRLNGG